MVSYEHNVVFSFPVETVLRGKEKEMWRLDNYLFSKQLIANTVDAYSGIELQFIYPLIALSNDLSA